MLSFKRFYGIDYSAQRWLEEFGFKSRVCPTVLLISSVENASSLNGQNEVYW